MTKKEILGMSKITYTYQITIPKKVRERCQFEQSDTILFVEEDGKLYIKTSSDA